jgi:hypothetical protein
VYHTPTHFLEFDIDAKCPVDRFPPPAFSDCDLRNVFEDWRIRIEELMAESRDLLREARLDFGDLVESNRTARRRS